MTPIDSLLVLGATMRLTRLVTRDDLGQWWVKDPVDSLFHPREERPQVLPDRYHRYVSGLDCPHCVGFWAGVGVLASYALIRKHPRAARAWRAGAGALSLSVVSVALGRQIGYWDSGDEE